MNKNTSEQRKIDYKLISDSIVTELTTIFNQKQITNSKKQTSASEKNLTLKQKSLSNMNFEIHAAMDAIQFTTIGSLTLSSQKIKENKHNTTLQFLVTDINIGIERNQLSTISAAFKTAAECTSGKKNTGVKLTLHQQLIESQGGYISIKSSPAQETSTFSFTLNFPKTDIKPTQKCLEERNILSEINKNTKLELNKNNQLYDLLMKKVLDDFGMTPTITNKDRIEIEKLETSDYDIILLNLQISKMNGFKATEYMYKSLNYTVPVYAFCADFTAIDLIKPSFTGNTFNDCINSNSELLQAAVTA